MNVLIVVLATLLGFEMFRSTGSEAAFRVGRVVLSGVLFVALRLALVDRSIESGEAAGWPDGMPVTVALLALSFGMGYGLVAFLARRRGQ